MKAKKRHITVCIACLLISACSNMTAGNLFSHYSAQNQELYQTVKQGQYSEASEMLDDYVAGEILDNLEKCFF